MGLQDRPEYYYSIIREVQKAACKYLDTNQSLSQQKDALLVEKVIRDIQLKNDYLMRFEKGWPVRDMLAQYLRNIRQRERREKKRIEENAGAEVEPDQETAEDGENTDEQNKDENDDIQGDADDQEPEVESENHEEESDGAESELDPPPTVTKKRRINNNAEAVVTVKSTKPGRKVRTKKDEVPQVLEPAAPSVVANGKPAPSRVANGKRKRDIATDLSESTKPGRKAQTKKDEAPQVPEPAAPSAVANGKQKCTKDKESDTISMVGEEQEPNDDDKDDAVLNLKTCPGMDCSDSIPDDIPTQLKTALTRYAYFLKEDRTDFRLAAEICIMVKREHQRGQALNIAKEKKWPATEIDFKDIPRRVFHMYEELKQLMLVSEARDNLFSWDCFEANLELDGWSINRFARMRASEIPMMSQTWRNSRGGYYGSKGTAIVMHTLLHLFRRNVPTNAFQPLPVMHYLCYFVVPHVVARLICQDYNTSMLMNGCNIMEASSDIGELINPERDDDSELDCINQKTTVMFRGASQSSQQTRIEAVDAAVAKALSSEFQPESSDVMPPRVRPKPRLVIRPPRMPEASVGADSAPGL
ncbi:hypothetical protein J3R83DRAFT_2978 [Lanmaoa asiatica]|nr:hypothetical protein J3R83DRAFT_2978 [Lanmaoa asiatica]